MQIWHALGALKKFGLSIIGLAGGRDPELARAMRMHLGYDLVVASSERCRAPFAEAFGVELQQVVVAPLPRVDRLRDEGERRRVRETFAALHPELSGKKVALFAPTFRSEGAESDAVDPLALTRALDAAGFATVVKLHPLVDAPTHPELTTAEGLSTQDLLLVADVFITDYSSAVFEAAVAGVPSYLLAPDLDQFVAERDFYGHYPDDLGLPLARTVDELAELVREGVSTPGDARRVADEWVAVPAGAHAAEGLARVVLARVTSAE